MKEKGYECHGAPCFASGSHVDPHLEAAFPSFSFLLVYSIQKLDIGKALLLFLLQAVKDW